MNSFCSSSGSPTFTVIFFLSLESLSFLLPSMLDFRDARARLHDVGQHHAAVVGLVQAETRML